MDSTGTDQFGTSYQLVSAFSILTGSYGPYIFGGNTNLQIFDSMYDDGFCCADFWIVRAGQPVIQLLSGKIVSGRSVTGLNLFIEALFLPNVAGLVRPPSPNLHRALAQNSYAITFPTEHLTTGPWTLFNSPLKRWLRSPPRLLW